MSKRSTGCKTNRKNRDKKREGMLNRLKLKTRLPHPRHEVSGSALNTLQRPLVRENK